MKNRHPFVPKFKYQLDPPDEEGVEVFLEENYRTTTLGQLKRRFYECNHWDEYPCKPLAAHIELDQNTAFPTDSGWWIMYYGGFHVLVEKHHDSNFGPHTAKLRYTASQVKRIHWIATVQIECFFFKEEDVVLRVYQAIRDKKFFLNPAEADSLVVL